MRRDQPRRVLVLGSGALKIGEAGEFDYSGSQAVKALREEGIATIVMNPNIATIQTSPGLADKIYLLAVDPEIGPERHPARTSGRDPDLLRRPDRAQLRARALAVRSSREGGRARPRHADRGRRDGRGPPEVRRAPRNHRGRGAAVDRGSFDRGRPEGRRDRRLSRDGAARLHARRHGVGPVRRPGRARAPRLDGPGALAPGPGRGVPPGLARGRVRSDAGRATTTASRSATWRTWTRSGIHTGESIVVAPSQTLDNDEYHRLRSVAFQVFRALGLVGEGNIQFALHPETGDFRVIEVNPQALAQLGARVQGDRLPDRVHRDEARGRPRAHRPPKNSVTGSTLACFEPALDYVVVKIPRWDLSRFSLAAPEIGSGMKSVGEVMAIGRTFEESLQKALRMLDIGCGGLIEARRVRRSSGRVVRSDAGADPEPRARARLGRDACGGRAADAHPSLVHRRDPERRGDGAAAAGSDAWRASPGRRCATAKEAGFSDAQIAGFAGSTRSAVREARNALRPAPPGEADRHARGRVSGVDELPLPHVAGATEDDVAANGPAGAPGPDPRRRALPDRLLRRVRLVLRRDGPGVPAAQAQDRDRQLQSRDREHGLRRERPPLLRGALARDASSRSGGSRTRRASSCRWAGRSPTRSRGR